jgi:hypothetical protein
MRSMGSCDRLRWSASPLFMLLAAAALLGSCGSDRPPEPASPGDVSLRRTRDGRLSVHLLNAAGMPLPDRHGFTDFIPPIEDITLTVKTGERPETVTWVPDGGRLEWRWNDGRLTVAVSELGIHGVLVVGMGPARP